jgi:hypothetical protein
MSVASRQFALACNIDSFTESGYDGVAPGLIYFTLSIVVSSNPTNLQTYEYPTGYTLGSFTGIPYTVNENDISVGDWVGTSNGQGIAYQIVGFTNDIPRQYVVADIDGYSKVVLNDQGFNTGIACIFRVNEDSLPMFSSPSARSFLQQVTSYYEPVQWVSDMLSRFASRNSKTQYVSIYQPLIKGGPQGKDFIVGESVYINSNGVFLKSANSLNISDTVGIVTSTGIPYDDWFSFRPSGKYFDNTYKTVLPEGFFPSPERIEQVGGNNVTLTPGMKLYVNPNAGRQYTSVAPTLNPYATWIMIDATRAIYIAGSGGGGGGGTTAVQVFDGGDPYWVSAPPTTIYPVLDCGGI